MIKIYETKKLNNKAFNELISKVNDSISTNDDVIKKVVADIIEKVIKKGDEYIFELAKRFDHKIVNEKNFFINETDIKKRLKDITLSNQEKKAFKNAFANIASYHKKQREKLKDFTYQTKESSSTLGWIYKSVKSCGLYVPGGKANYPSSVLMCAIPAIMAGVKDIYIATPNIDNKYIIYAASLVGAKGIYQMGGAQAIAALAYGTKLVKRVDTIVGPGNSFVAQAKKQVYGDVGIDMIAGPSELLVICDDLENIAIVAADMLAQAEHDENARTFAIVPNNKMADLLILKINQSIIKEERKDIISKSLDANCTIFVEDNREKIVQIVDNISPEHLQIISKDEEYFVQNITNAGAIFLSKSSAEVIGDYYAGPSHCLPTGGASRFSSVLSCDTFLKRVSYIKYSQEDIEKNSEDIMTIAKIENLYAHARAIEIRVKSREEEK